MEKFSLIKLKPHIYIQSKQLSFAYTFLKPNSGIEEAITSLEELKRIKEYAEHKDFILKVGPNNVVYATRNLTDMEKNILTIYLYHQRITFYNRIKEGVAQDLKDAQSKKNELEAYFKNKHFPFKDENLDNLQKAVEEVTYKIRSGFKFTSIFSFFTDAGEFGKLENEKSFLEQKIEMIKEQRKKFNQSTEDTSKKEDLARVEVNIQKLNDDLARLKDMTRMGSFHTTQFPPVSRSGSRGERIFGHHNPNQNMGMSLIGETVELAKVLETLAISVSECKSFIEEHQIQESQEIITLLESL